MIQFDSGPRSLKLRLQATDGAVAQMDQTTERFLRIEAIFHEALAAPDEARAELIETRCHGDRELAAEVRSLLEACEAEEHLTASRRLGAGRWPGQSAGSQASRAL